jgi:membrane protease YdiL (CAAX protease family)
MTDPAMEISEKATDPKKPKSDVGENNANTRKLFYRRAAIVIAIIMCIGFAEFFLFVYGQFSDIAFDETADMKAAPGGFINDTDGGTQPVLIEYFTVELELTIVNLGRIPAEDMKLSSWLEVTNRTGSISKILPAFLSDLETLGVLEEKTINVSFPEVPVNYDIVIEFHLEVRESGEITEKINATLKTKFEYNFEPVVKLVSENLLSRNSNIFIAAVSIEGILVLVTIILGTIVITDKLLALSVSALGLAPLFRIVNVATPVAVDFLVFVTMSYGFLLVAVFIFIYVNQISWRDIGVTFKKWYIFMPIALAIGFLLAPIEYAILGPPAWIPENTFFNLVVLTLVMIFFVGLAEEMMFRALIQTHLEKLLTPWLGLFLTALLFGIMHGVWTSYRELLFTFAAGLLFGYIYRRTKNLPFVAVLHGLEDVFLFGLLPFIWPD